ncbi:hypothetical protein [Actinomycetospora sp. NBRC 106378]|uniref:hypothetical protein n=1 Tax=Actinomycetospora sp. NBRC 106378 TaxID=3032208 RepID=UPI0024A1CEE3|nr:hypothetical protein [Actinomycetospora sp. NBRC 106378]GLZ56082.1 hypothetical protein Acsp07_56990 [Actinomycetospora sp. NBRC 106378]
MSTSFDGSARHDEADTENSPESVPSDSATMGRKEPWSVRLERTRRGRIAISVFLVVLVGSLLVINAPASATKRGLMTVVAPVLSALGMEQGWGVFAPNPRGFSLEVEAHIQQVDGSQRIVPIESGRGLDEYWTYRWQRWADRLANGPDNVAMWDPFCRYLADQDRAAGGKPVRVALVNRRSDTLPPGDGPARGPAVYREFFAIGVAP